MYKNDTKQGAAEIPSPSTSVAPKVAKSSKSLSKISAEIHNLPGGSFVLTCEILKNNVCRICATYHDSGPKLLPLYLCENGLNISRLANMMLPIKVRKEDGLPEFVCNRCAKQLLAWHTMRDNSRESEKLLISHAERITNYYGNRVERSQLTETVESVLASYLPTVGSMELVCQTCDTRTTSEGFVEHLASKHADVRDRDDLETFVRDHVTFEEALESDSDDVMSTGSAATAEASDVTRLESPICSNTRRPSRHLTEHTEQRCVNWKKTDLIRERRLRRDRTRSDKTPARIPRSATESNVVTTGGPAPRPPDETNQKRIPAVCPDCNRTFSNKYNMLNHMRSHSEGESVKFDCECGKRFSTRGNLAAHSRARHARAAPHACAGCGAGFPTRAARDVHARLHSGARPFSCPHCALSFRAKNSRDKHLDTHAPRRFECQLCGRRFRRIAHLRYHVGTHRRCTRRLLDFVDLMDSSDEEEALPDTTHDYTVWHLTLAPRAARS